MLNYDSTSSTKYSILSELANFVGAIDRCTLLSLAADLSSCGSSLVYSISRQQYEYSYCSSRGTRHRSNCLLLHLEAYPANNTRTYRTCCVVVLYWTRKFESGVVSVTRILPCIEKSLVTSHAPLSLGYRSEPNKYRAKGVRHLAHHRRIQCVVRILAVEFWIGIVWNERTGSGRTWLSVVERRSPDDAECPRYEAILPYRDKAESRPVLVQYARTKTCASTVCNTHTQGRLAKNSRRKGFSHSGETRCIPCP